MSGIALVTIANERSTKSVIRQRNEENDCILAAFFVMFMSRVVRSPVVIIIPRCLSPLRRQDNLPK